MTYRGDEWDIFVAGAVAGTLTRFEQFEIQAIHDPDGMVTTSMRIQLKGLGRWYKVTVEREADQ